MYKIILVTEQSFYPDSSGGSEISTAYLLNELHKRDWQVEVICTCSIKSPSLWKSWSRRNRISIYPPAILDLKLGYPIWRLFSRFLSRRKLLGFLDKRLKMYNPDIVLGLVDINCPLLNHAINHGYKCFYIARVAEIISGDKCLPKGLNIIANSPFIASVLSNILGGDYRVVLPFINQEDYKVVKRERKYVTFINPVPQKGVKIAIEVAKQLPDIKFLFVKGNWFHYRGSEEHFISEARSLPNIEFWENKEDVRRIYEVTDILLVPSIFQETFGRVILEAQVNGIPVIASRVGGIDYTLGLGGVLVDSPESAEAYVKAITELKSNVKYYEDLSFLAVQNTQRVEFNPDFQINNFIEIINDYLGA